MKNLFKSAVLCASFVALAGCFGGLRTLNVRDFTDQRVTDLSLTKKVTGKREFIFFSTTKMGVFLEGSIQGIITDYQGNPIEGVTIKIMPESAKDKNAEAGVDAFAAGGENANSYINLSFSPGISDTMGLYKIHFSLPVADNEVDLKGKLVYNPGWDQQKMNLGKAYEPQTKETPFRLYYSLKTGFLAFAEGVRKTVVQPVGEGTGRLNALPGAKAPVAKPPPNAEGAPAAGKAEEDLFKGFDFGQ